MLDTRSVPCSRKLGGLVRFLLARRSVPIVDCTSSTDHIYFEYTIGTMLEVYRFRSSRRSVPNVEFTSFVYILVTIPGESKHVHTVFWCEGSIQIKKFLSKSPFGPTFLVDKIHTKNHNQHIFFLSSNMQKVLLPIGPIHGVDRCPRRVAQIPFD